MWMSYFRRYHEKDFIRFLTVLMFIACLYSCKKDKSEIECYPCLGKKAVSAEFTIEELADNPGENERRTITDTSYSNKSIRFHALEDDADYT